MKDWKGNEIKEGDTILKVQVKNWDAGSQMQVGIMAENGTHWGERFNVKEDHLWIIREEIFIKPHGESEEDNLVTMSFMKPYTATPLGCADMHLSCQPWEILCIKGKSDSEEQYYTEKFKI